MRIESNLPNAPIGNAPNSTVALSRPGFSKALEQAQQPATSGVRSIKPGDTLTSIVREQAQINGVKLTPSEEFRWTQALAADSGIQNANAIFPGQKIQMQNMLNQWQAGKNQPQGFAQNPSIAKNTSAVKTNESIPTIVVTAARPTTSLQKPNYINAVAHPVLSKTLDRAVARGFIPKVEQQDVYNKVLQVAN
ncbi:MAG: LysM peptidoglycan-binding domain-containing protein, partial [Limnohabitans sp.]